MTVIECVLKAGGVLLATCAGWAVLSAAVLDLAFRMSAVPVEQELEREPRRAVR